ncbi:fucose mutarotase-like [Patiria miniata]|uniref:Fucose mutarotase n=1 Tax=Patiria miniata TaxID=46514 RepID=A0A913Z4A7_PATMI|nr:fucose mutarotase-like [Patiria miniata]
MVVLKGIPRILSPELLLALAQMGHGDEIVLADANFPSSGVCRAGPREIRADGHGIPELLEAVLQLFPLDAFVPAPAMLMDLVPEHKKEKLPTPVWDKYQTLLDAAEGKHVNIEKIERFAFYERAKKAFAVVATGEEALYGNLILKKGVISSGQ